MKRVFFWLLDRLTRWPALFRRRRRGASAPEHRSAPPNDVYPMW